MAILFPVKREMAILFLVKRDLDPPFTTLLIGFDFSVVTVIVASTTFRFSSQKGRFIFYPHPP